jgi:GNAT superfamily N-acetyltransferase
MSLTDLRIVKELPKDVSGIEEAVKNFVRESNKFLVPMDENGLYQQTVNNIANATYGAVNNVSQFWLAEELGQVACYVLTHVSTDVDNQLCFWITQAYVAKEFRRTPHGKRWMSQLKDEAKRRLCKHIVIVSSRGIEPYCRFLGDGCHLYTNLLKIDL